VLNKQQQLIHDNNNNGVNINEMTMCISIDVDMSWRPFGYHIGAHRSPVRTLAHVQQLVNHIVTRPTVKLVGVMGYEVMAYFAAYDIHIGEI
jgi:D-serine deaminase-like pyridoxal phosphate-dependent protein